METLVIIIMSVFATLGGHFIGMGLAAFSSSDDEATSYIFIGLLLVLGWLACVFYLLTK